MEYLPLFLLFMAVLIAAYFYLQRAKARDARKEPAADASEPAAAAPAVSAASAAPQQTEPERPADRPE